MSEDPPWPEPHYGVQEGHGAAADNCAAAATPTPPTPSPPSSSPPPDPDYPALPQRGQPLPKKDDSAAPPAAAAVTAAAAGEGEGSVSESARRPTQAREGETQPGGREEAEDEEDEEKEKVEEKGEEKGEEEEADGGGRGDVKAPETNIAPLEKDAMEIAFQHCLLDVLHTELGEKDLPSDSSGVYSKMLAKCPNVQKAPAFLSAISEFVDLGVVESLASGEAKLSLDAKKTNYKKLQKFFSVMATKGKLIQIKETKKGTMVTSVNRSHPTYLSYAPAEAPKSSSAAAASEGGGAAEDSSRGMPGAPDFSGVRVVEKYRPSDRAKALFTSLGEKGRNLYTEAEMRGMLDRYIDANPRVVDGDVIRPDAAMRTALYGKAEKCADAATLSRAETTSRFLMHQDRAHVIVHGGSPEDVPPDAAFAKGPPKKIVLTVKTIRSNTHVTWIENLKDFGVDINSFREFVAKKFACSATVCEGPAGIGTAVKAQGAIGVDLEHLLVNSMKLEKAYIKLVAPNR
eukprot:GHVU01038348.1.p1 GENE.GHVU01038348.1~~GHVU01038348.1.p1  ORF type:complete len:515 (-),score=134.78 GHVU01038348.1:177-1721(-)